MACTLLRAVVMRGMAFTLKFSISGSPMPLLNMGEPG